MPARSHFWIKRMMRLSPIRCSRKRTSQSWLTAPKKFRMSASSIQFTFLILIAVDSASNASCGRRFADILADACARIGGDAVSYSFIAVDFHHILLASLPAHSLALRPAHSRGHQIVTANRRLQPFCYLHDCSDCFRLERIAGWVSHPLESAAFSRRTPIPAVRCTAIEPQGWPKAVLP